MANMTFGVNIIPKDNTVSLGTSQNKWKINGVDDPKLTDTTYSIVNNLTETTTGKVLDATQGKVLKDTIDNLTPADIEAVPANLTLIADCDDNTLQNPSQQIHFYATGDETLNTPYKQGLTGSSGSILFVFGSANYTTQISYTMADRRVFIRAKTGIGSTWNGKAWTASVTGIKGDTESSYRTGDVNLTPANIGAVANTAVIDIGHGGTNASSAYTARVNLDAAASVTTHNHSSDRAAIWNEITKIPVGHTAPIFITDTACSILTRTKLRKYMHGTIARTNAANVMIMAAADDNAIYTWSITGLNTDNYTPGDIIKYTGTVYNPS